MDRGIVYPGSIPLDTDLLFPQRAAMVGIGGLAQMLLGSTTVVDGLTVGPTSPASLNVQVSPGSIVSSGVVDVSAYGSLSAVTASSTMKQGISATATTLAITPPATAGYSQVFLVQAQYQETDASPAVLQYYNASNPSVPWYGPANAGTPQNTRRLGSVAIQLKAGTAVATGSQVAPSADAGWTGLATVTVANGATTITIGNVADLATGNTRPTLRLPQIGNGFGNELAAAGYQALPSGLIVQWGSYTGTPTVSDGIGYENTSIAVTFPIAFPTACYAVLATPIDATTGGAGGGYEGAWVAATNVSGFTGCVRFKNSGTAVTAYYLAVGK